MWGVPSGGMQTALKSGTVPSAPSQVNTAPLDPNIPVTVLNGVAYNYAGEIIGRVPTGGGGGGGTAPAAPRNTYTAPVKSAAQLAAEQAERERQARIAQANALKPEVQSRVNSIVGIYDSLYGDVNNVLGDKTGQINERHNAEVGSLTNQFNSEFPKIGNAYGSRGTYDSSYRMDAEEGATNAFNSGVGELGRGLQEDLGKVGEWGTTTKAKFGAEQGNLRALWEKSQKSENPDELKEVINKLITTFNEVNASKAGYRSRASYLGELNSVVPQSQRSVGLSSNLGNVLKSAVPANLKRSIGQQLINNSGLTPAEQEAALAEFSAQLSADEDKLKQQTTAPAV